MKKLLLILILFASPALATTRYIATSAGVYSGGTACDGQTAITVTTFNNTTLAADDIAYICGTLTGSAGANSFLKPKNGGTSGHPIQIIFDTSGILTATYWGAATGAIDVSFSYVVIDGANVGTITASANGNSPKANNQGSRGIYVASAAVGIEIKNLTISQIYVHTQGGTTGGQPDSECIAIAGSTGIKVHGNTISDCYYGISRIAGGPATSGYEWYSNTITKTNWAFKLTAGIASETIDSTYIYDNDVEMGNDWDDVNSAYNHHNGLYAFTDVAGLGQITNLYFYNNYIHGITVGGWVSTAMLFTSYAVRSIYVFNNVLVGNSGDPSDAYINPQYGISANTALIVNNTIIGSSNADYTNAYGTITPRCYTLANNTSTTATIQNNICYTVAQGTLTSAGSTFSQNYNLTNNVSYYGVVNGTYYASFASWQGSSRDGNGSSAAPDLNGTYGLNSGSPAISLGTNLYSTCNGGAVPGIGALCLDKAGITRPVAADWDAGAYQHGGPVITSITPSSGAEGATANVTITGSGFQGGNAVVTVSGTGITVSNTVVVSDTSITVDFAVAASATVSARTVTVTTDVSASNTSTFTVTCTSASVAFSSQPSSAALNQTLGAVSVQVRCGDASVNTGSTASVVIAKDGSATWNALATASSLTKSAVAGVATWTDLSVTPTTGSGSITAASSGLTGATSNSITISSSAATTPGRGTRGRVRSR